ncbi:MAG: hypothetical protein Unbinned4294contig1001_30 [Prokaryotic dsDNA virus sp.]|jgi:hypothetical protein|nr:MAG: hypothetical protein Unbinned4294contig1001_30 [Prokaryotic dsDNA virus sp.]
MYLIFSSEEAALERADEEGKANNFAYWTEGLGTRWLTNPVLTADGMWALDVSEYDLDELEQTTTVESVVFPEPIE